MRGGSKFNHPDLAWKSEGQNVLEAAKGEKEQKEKPVAEAPAAAAGQLFLQMSRHRTRS